MSIFERRNNYFVSHRGFTPLAPENSLPSFYYAGLFGQWAIETDIHITRDGVLVCCHNDSIKKYCDIDVKISEMTYSELCAFQIINGNRAECFSEEERRIPKFSEYLEICRRFNGVPFPELKTDNIEEVFYDLHKCGFSDDEFVISSTELSRLEKSRTVSKTAFIHWIFAEEDKIESFAKLGNGGLSLLISDPFECTADKVKEIQSQGLKMCLRAADSIKAYERMKELKLDYFPTNKMHREMLKGRE